jgi:hypothetical protein
MRDASPSPHERAFDVGALALAGLGGALWLDRPIGSADVDAARLLGGVAAPGSPLLETFVAAALRPLAFDARVLVAQALTIAAWALTAALVASRVRPTILAAGPASFARSAMPGVLRWVVAALVLACAPVVGTFHVGGALVPLALVLAADELDHDGRHGAAALAALIAALQGPSFAFAGLVGGVVVMARTRSLAGVARLLAPGLALAIRALPIAEHLHPLAFLERLPASPLPALPVDGVVVGLGCAGVVVAILRRAMPNVRPATEAIALGLVLPLVCVDRESWLGLDAATARALVVVALARPMAAAAAASFTLAGRDTLARYRQVFLGVAWLAFVARAGTDLACRARDTLQSTDHARGIVADVPADAVVMVDDDGLFARLVVARALGALGERATVLRWSNERPARLAAELDRDEAFRPMVRDLALRGQGDPRTLFDLAKTRPVRSTAGAMWTADTAARLVPAGFFLRALDEEREPANVAKTPTLEKPALEATLASLRTGTDRAGTIEAHRLLCTEAALFASSSRREIAGRYCRLMAPASDTVRCSVCPSELRLSARDR